jgi:hypothetical protein
LTVAAIYGITFLDIVIPILGIDGVRKLFSSRRCPSRNLLFKLQMEDICLPALALRPETERLACEVLMSLRKAEGGIKRLKDSFRIPKSGRNTFG